MEGKRFPEPGTQQATTRVIKVRVNTSQLEQIRADAQTEGFKTIADYIRFLALQFNVNAQVRLVDIQVTTTRILEVLQHEQRQKKVPIGTRRAEFKITDRSSLATERYL